MEDLKDLYLALLARFKILIENQHKLPNEPIIELRLDIEQLIALICKENEFSYDGLLSELNSDEVVENLWKPDSETDDD